MGSGLVEEEATAYLDLLILAQLYLVQEIRRQLGGLLLVHLSPKTRALEIRDRNHIVVKLSSLFSVHPDDDSMEEIPDARVVDLDGQRCQDNWAGTI